MKQIDLSILGVRMSNLVPSEMCQHFHQGTLEAAFNKGFKGRDGETFYKKPTEVSTGRLK